MAIVPQEQGDERTGREGEGSAGRARCRGAGERGGGAAAGAGGGGAEKRGQREEKGEVTSFWLDPDILKVRYQWIQELNKRKFNNGLGSYRPFHGQPPSFKMLILLPFRLLQTTVDD